MAQPAAKVSQQGPKWAHLVPLLPTLDALLATWRIPLPVFTHFYQVFVNICVFLLKINGQFRKFQEIAVKSIDFTQNDNR